MDAPRPPHEHQHLETLSAMKVLDTPPEERFDRISRLAACLFDAPIAIVSFTDAERQWSKSLYGLAECDASRDASFCAHAIMADEVLVVEDASQDPRFAHSPLVQEEPRVRFYAGAPLRLPDGHNLGTLCIMDHQPRAFGAAEQEQLQDLAALVVDEVLRRRVQAHHLHLFEAHPQPMWVYDVETLRFLHVNAAALDVYGYTREQFLRMTLADIRPDADMESLHRSVREAPNGREHSAGWRHLTSNGEVLDVEISSHPIIFRGREARHVQVTDVTAQRRTEQALHLRNAILKAAGTAADTFLRATSWEQAIDDVLQRLGAAADVDRVYLFENTLDEQGALRTSQRFEWVASGVEPQIDDPELQSFSYEAFDVGYWTESFRRHEPVYGTVDTFPEPLVTLLHRQDVQALALVPVFAGEEWWGFLGFDACHERSPWSEPEVEALKVVASTLGAAIHREQTEAAMREREESYRNLFDSVTDAIYIQRPDGRFLNVNQGALAMYGYAREDIVGQTPAMLSAPGLNDHDALAQRSVRVLEGATERFEWWGQRANGEIFPKELVLNRGTYRGETVIIATARDISERLQAEEKLRRIRKAVDQSSDGIIILSPQGELLYENEAQVQLVGYTAQEVQARGGGITVYEDSTVYERIVHIMREGGSWQGETTLQHRDGHPVTVAVRADAIYDEAGELVSTVVFHTDVTEQREAEQTAETKGQHLRLALEAARMGTWDWDMRSGHVNWSDNVHDIIDSAEPFDGTFESYLQIIHPDDRPSVHDAIDAALESGNEYRTEHRIVNTLGETRWLSGRGRVFFDADGEPIRMAGTVTDITERKRVRERLAHLASYPELNPEPVVEVDREGRITYVNPTGRSFLSFAPEEVQRRLATLPELFAAQAEDDWLVHEARLSDAVFELRISRVPGSDQLRAYVHEVTEQRQAEQALRESEARARTLFERAPLGMALINEEHHITQANDTLASMLGYERDALCGLPLHALTFAEDLEEAHSRTTSLFDESGSSYEVERRFRRADGSAVWIRTSTAIVRDEGGETAYVIGMFEDITERKKSEQALRESEQRFRAIFQRGPLGMALITQDRTLHQVNEALCRMLGYEQDELVGCSADVMTLPELAEISGQRTKALFAGEAESYQIEKEFVRRDGSQMWMRVTTAALCDEHGRPQYGLGMFEDVTERREYEQQLIEAKEHAEEMNRLKSAFLANMSHEIRTPLTAISGFAEILAEEVRAENREFVQLIRDSSRRLMDTLNSILDLAQLESKTLRLQMETVDLKQAVPSILQPFYERAASRGLDLRLEAPPEPLLARLDPGVLERVLSNLVSNALKFTLEGHVAVTLTRSAGGHVTVTVEDTGVGIGASFLPHIFEEFQQESSGLTRDYEGTGLGLTITKRLIGLMGGSIDVASVKGQGTTFTIMLPGLQSDEPALEPAPAALRDKPHVLVVEDNVFGGRLMQKILEKTYHVELVTSGEAALQQADRHRYDAVLMDISLGSAPDGEEVMRRLRRLPAYAAVPIAAVTAHVLPGDEAHLLAAGFDAYVSKPFTRQEILDLLNQLLGEEESAT